MQEIIDQDITKEQLLIEKEKIRKRKKEFICTRHQGPPQIYDPTIPRLGRRESEPHSREIMYLWDVLTSNFPKDRTMWDLHHYFNLDGDKIDIQFDLSFYIGFDLPYELPSYKASNYDNRVPTVAFNVLSKSTWKDDLSIHLDYCRMLKIPIYAVFSPYVIPPKPYKPPFLRVYILQKDGEYNIKELNKLTVNEKGEIDPDAILNIENDVPFRFGIIKRKTQFLGGTPLFRVALIYTDKDEIIPTKFEKLEHLFEEKTKLAEEKTKLAEENRKLYEIEKSKRLSLEKEIDELKKKTS